MEQPRHTARRWLGACRRANSNVYSPTCTPLRNTGIRCNPTNVSDILHELFITDIRIGCSPGSRQRPSTILNTNGIFMLAPSLSPQHHEAQRQQCKGQTHLHVKQHARICQWTPGDQQSQNGGGLRAVRRLPICTAHYRFGAAQRRRHHGHSECVQHYAT